MRVKQSVCYPMVKPADIPLDTFFGRVADMGYVAIEFWKPDETFDDVVKLANKHNLAISQMSGHDSLPVGLNNPAEHDRIEKELRVSIDMAADAGIPGVIVFSGNRLPGVSEEAMIEAAIEGLKRMAPIAEAKNINLNMELLNTIVDHPGYQNDHSAWGLHVVKAVNSPNVKLLYDIYHMQVMEGNLIETIRNNTQWIGHFHTAGVPGRNDLDDLQEINYRGVCKAIAETEYDLYVAHEFRAKGDVYEALAQAFEVCNQV